MRKRSVAMVDARPAEERQFGAITVCIALEDIAVVRADVLVNAANTQLHMGGGVAAALRSRGGIEIHQEAIRQAPAALGSVVRTGAGKLDARFVYHAVVIDYDVSKGTSASDVATVMRNVFRQASSDGVNSIGLPLFGAGVGGLGLIRFRGHLIFRERGVHDGRETRELPGGVPASNGGAGACGAKSGGAVAGV
jgi:O-acetyl-ADP-ribose deacetylase (regulator of RNase III)